MVTFANDVVPGTLSLWPFILKRVIYFVTCVLIIQSCYAEAILNTNEFQVPALEVMERYNTESFRQEIKKKYFLIDLMKFIARVDPRIRCLP